MACALIKYLLFPCPSHSTNFIGRKSRTCLLNWYRLMKIGLRISASEWRGITLNQLS